MQWNWQQPDWTDFSYEKRKLELFEQRFLQGSGLLFGAYKHLSENDKTGLKIEIISTEALKTSEIEGEYLNRDSVQSSVRRQFGIALDNRRTSAAEQGIAELMVNIYRSFDEPLTDKMLFNWHKMLTKGRRDIKDIGRYRTHTDPMQIISGGVHSPKVHFEAPASKSVTREMKQFITWFNATSPSGKHPLPAITRAGIAHLYFESIHPFEDGNGRIGRAISEKALAQSIGQPTLLALAYVIGSNKKAYYNALEHANKSNHITEWLSYFSQTTLDAQLFTQKRIEFLISKTKLYAKLKDAMNPRQEKVLERMFREDIDGFKGGLSAENYISITKTSRATATRDLHDLVIKEALTKSGELKHTRYYLNLE